MREYGKCDASSKNSFFFFSGKQLISRELNVRYFRTYSENVFPSPIKRINSCEIEVFSYDSISIHLFWGDIPKCAQNYINRNTAIDSYICQRSCPKVENMFNKTNVFGLINDERKDARVSSLRPEEPARPKQDLTFSDSLTDPEFVSLLDMYFHLFTFVSFLACFIHKHDGWAEADGETSCSGCLRLLRRKRRRSGDIPNNGGEEEEEDNFSSPSLLFPVFLLLLLKITHFHFKGAVIESPPATICLNSPPVAWKIETSVCRAPDHEKQSCWGWLVSQRVNIFHWCFQVVIYCTIIYWLDLWMLHWVTNETAFEACTSFAISRWKIWLWTVSASSGGSASDKHGGNFPEV